MGMSRAAAHGRAAPGKNATMGQVPSRYGEFMACPSCGSWAVKADRSMAGRMVCARCGQPLGLGVSASVTQGGRRRRPTVTLPKRWRVWLALAGLVGLSAALAAQSPKPVGREPTPSRPLAPPRMGETGRPWGLGM